MLHRGQLRGADAKLDWAKGELQALAEEIQSWLNGRTGRSTSDFYPQANVVALRVEFDSTPVDWGIRAGNLVHCYRSALDYLVTDLAVLNKHDPVAGPGGNQFPILSKPPVSRSGKPITFAQKTSGTLAGVHREHREMIESIQPYRPEVDFTPYLNPLEALRDLSNADKHRVLPTLMLGVPPDFEIPVSWFTEGDIAEVSDFTVLLKGHLNDGAVIGCADVVPSGPDPKMGCDVELPLQIVFGNGINVLFALSNLARSIRNILDWFRPVFAGEVPGDPPVPVRRTQHADARERFRRERGW